MHKQNQETNDIVTLDASEIEQVSGGIIIVGGSTANYVSSTYQSPLSWVALNPQPLPPRYSFRW